VNSVNAAAQALTGNPEEYVNREEIEIAWAMKAFQYAETHMKIIQSVDAKDLRLTKYVCTCGVLSHMYVMCIHQTICM
jgi:hypothetical protein